MGCCSLLTGHAFCALPGTVIKFTQFPAPACQTLCYSHLPFFFIKKISACTVECFKAHDYFKHHFGLKNCTPDSVEDTFMVGCLACMSARSDSKLQQKKTNLAMTWEKKRGKKWSLNICQDLSSHSFAVEFHSAKLVFLIVPAMMTIAQIKYQWAGHCYHRWFSA